jgi:class 3 adenylate cyclase
LDWNISSATPCGSERPAVCRIAEFLTGHQAEVADDRVLATVLFTDIVDSTRRAAEMGDRDWHALLDAHDAVVRSRLSRFRGREVNTSGDGFLAMFDGPQRAIRCAMAIRDAVQALGIEVRAGLHTGECEIRGDDIGGIAVHIGARVSAMAGANDVLVSSTLRDLVIGSGLEFEDRGVHESRRAVRPGTPLSPNRFHGPCRRRVPPRTNPLSCPGRGARGRTRSELAAGPG